MSKNNPKSRTKCSEPVKPIVIKEEKLTDYVNYGEATSSRQAPESSTQHANKKSTKKFACVICDQEFNRHADMIDHFRQHGSELDIRGRPVLESTLLKYPPIKVESVVKPIDLIECEWCIEVFHTISKAIGHKFRKHRFETNYFCKTCGKLFPLKVVLRQHEKVEHNKSDETENEVEAMHSQTTQANDSTQEIPSEVFACQICTETFENQEALLFHEKCVHRIEKQLLAPTICPPPSKKIKMNNANEVISVYYCHLCGTEYEVKFNLRKHLEDHHTDAERNQIPSEGIIICKTCESIFYSKKAYEVHNINHRPDDLYVTSEEQRQRVVARIDQDYDVRRVPQTLEKFIPVATTRNGQIRTYSRRKRDLVPPITSTKLKLDGPCSSSSKPQQQHFRIKLDTINKNDESRLSPICVDSSDDDDEIPIAKPNIQKAVSKSAQ